MNADRIIAEYVRERVDETLCLFRSLFDDRVIGWHISGYPPVFLELLGQCEAGIRKDQKDRSRTQRQISAMRTLSDHVTFRIALATAALDYGAQ